MRGVNSISAYAHSHNRKSLKRCSPLVRISKSTSLPKAADSVSSEIEPFKRCAARTIALRDE